MTVRVCAGSNLPARVELTSSIPTVILRGDVQFTVEDVVPLSVTPR